MLENFQNQKDQDSFVLLTDLANMLKEEITQLTKDPYDLEYLRIFPVAHLVLKQDKNTKRPDNGIEITWKYKDHLPEKRLIVEFLATPSTIQTAYTTDGSIPHHLYSLSRKNVLQIPNYIRNSQKHLVDYIVSLIRTNKVKSIISNPNSLTPH